MATLACFASVGLGTSLHPTWVSGLIRYAQGQHANHAEVRAWRKITKIVRASSPQAQFDVTLNAKHYRNGDELKRMMSRVRTDLDNDGWFLDFFSTAYRRVRASRLCRARPGPEPTTKHS